ncbi:MAG TPA: GxxExxY protein [Pseudoxanthomonas sp.]|nr:GxxExxY protein [Pseudoxanthomonas sp.]
MDANKAELEDADLTKQVIGIFYSVYNELGPGFLESVYENSMTMALREAGLEAAQQVPLNVWFRDNIVGEFKVDLLVSRRLVIELKAVSQLSSIHEVQLVNYLKATRLGTGLLFNFGPKPQFKRRVYGSVLPSSPSSALIRVQKNVQ